jgi:molecular chaperone DnaJ
VDPVLTDARRQRHAAPLVSVTIAPPHGRRKSIDILLPYEGNCILLIDHAYAELGLTPGASEAEVKAAWRRLVSQWHPDRNKTTSALGRMQRINTAYEQIRLAGFEPGSPAANDTAAEPQPAASTRTIRRRVRLTLEEAAFGCVKVLRGKVTHECARCEGRGYRVLDGACGVCEGHGVVRHHAWYGWVSTKATCGACQGERVARQVCDGCDGAGRHTRTYRHSARIPAGVRHADVLHVAQAEDGPFELHVELSPHKFFVLDDDGILRCEMPVDGFAWMTDRWVDVPTLSGVQQMRLKRGHHVYRLRGQGYPCERRGVRGDYVVTVVPNFPESLSAEQEALIERLSAMPTGPLRTWKRTLQAWDRGRHKTPSAP